MLININNTTWINPEYIVCLDWYYEDPSTESGRRLRIITSHGATLEVSDPEGYAYTGVLLAANEKVQ